MSEFSATNAPDPLHWILNWHFSAFRTIWLYSGPFGCHTNLVGKRAELVQMFEPRSCVRIFCNERTRSTPLDPKLTFWCISYHLGTFGTVWLPYKTRWKTGRTSANVRATKSRQNFSQRTHPIHPISPKTDVLVHSEPFGTVWLPYETRWKTGRTSAKVRAAKSRRNFSQRTHPIHSIGP